MSFLLGDDAGSGSDSGISKSATNIKGADSALDDFLGSTTTNDPLNEIMMFLDPSDNKV